MESPNVEREEENKCCVCNAQICSSYVLGMFACVLVIGGVYLSFHKWDYMWLVVSAIGIVLILIGALLHFCGSNSKKKDTRMRHTVNEQDLHEHLLPTAPPLSNAYSVSQLSLNMLPPYFSALDNVLMSSQSFPSAPPNSDNISQIVQIKGQSFILLPISENIISSDNESIARWSNQLNAPKDQTNRQQVPKAENPVTAVLPVTEECGCQTEALNLHQVTQTSENGIQTSVSSHREVSQVQTTPSSFTVIEETSTDESLANSTALQVEDLRTENTDQSSCSHDAITNDDTLPCDVHSEEILPIATQDDDSSDSTNETQMEILESGESTDSISTDCQLQVSSPEEEFSVSTDDSDTAINMNTFPDNIPSPPLDNLAQPSLHPPNSEIPSDSVISSLPNHSPAVIPLVTSHSGDNRVNADINENYPEPAVVATDIVNNNDTVDNVNNPQSTQCSEYSATVDSTHDISNAEHRTYPVTALLSANENYLEQYSENNSDIDDAEICDRSSPPPSYEEVTQENLVIAGHGVAYHGTI